MRYKQQRTKSISDYNTVRRLQLHYVICGALLNPIEDLRKARLTVADCCTALIKCPESSKLSPKNWGTSSQQ